MYTPPKTWVRGAMAALVLAAVVGLYLGVSRSGSGKDVAADTGFAPTPSSTTVAKALPDAPAIDEDRVRGLARQEAEAAIARSRPVKKAVETDTTSDGVDDTASTTPTAAPTATTRPASSAFSRPTLSRTPTSPPTPPSGAQQIPY